MTEEELRKRFGEKATDVLMAMLRAGGAPEIDPQLFNIKLAEAGIEIDVVALLDAAAQVPLIERLSTWRCPQASCRRVIDADAVANHQCPYCGTDFREVGEKPVQTIIYRGSTGGSRSVPWLIAIHGFNTRAPWQEEFSWRIANRYKYHAPVLIYKYGLVRFGVLFRWRHRMLAEQLAQRIRKAIRHARENQIEEPPDVIIHSFGSQLFRLLLESSECSDLRFGRVIAVGSIIRPDFDWSSYIREGRIEAVLGHCGGRDLAVPFAQFVIPNSGPGGRLGFVDSGVINVRNSQYGHSTALTEGALARNLIRNGLWDRFLREPVAIFSDPEQFKLQAWSPVPALVRRLTHVSIIILLSIFAVLPALLLFRRLCG